MYVCIWGRGYMKTLHPTEKFFHILKITFFKTNTSNQPIGIMVDSLGDQDASFLNIHPYKVQSSVDQG